MNKHFYVLLLIFLVKRGKTKQRKYFDYVGMQLLAVNRIALDIAMNHSG